LRKATDSTTKRLLRLKLAAAYLSISPNMLRSLIQKGELEIVKLGDNGHAPWLVDIHDLDQLVERKKATL
jgi:hypothetical protein